MKIFEAISFGAIAISLHIIAISFFLPETLGSNQNGEDGEQETITLSSISFSASDLIKAWETSPEIKSVVPALLRTPQSLSVNLPFTKEVTDLDTEIGSVSDLKLLQNDLSVSRPIIPAAFAKRAYSTVSVDQTIMQNNDNILLPSVSYLIKGKYNYNYRISYSKGYRNPSIKERYYEWADHEGGPELLGNPNLIPTKNDYVSISFDKRTFINDFSVKGFRETYP